MNKENKCKELLEKIKQTPDSIIEEAIDSLGDKMHKEEVKKAIKALICSQIGECYFPKRRSCKNCLDQNRRMIKRYIKQLEQKETILDKVTDRLKKIKKELEDDGYDYYAKEITKTLNMIEGDEK